MGTLGVRYPSLRTDPQPSMNFGAATTFRPIGLAVALLCNAPASPAADDGLPKPFPKARYEPLRRESPFALASPQATPTPPQASFASNWFVSGIARIGDEDFVTIKSRDLSTQFSLFGRGDAVNGVGLASVTWSEAVGKSTVILRKGTETAKLEFNEAELHATPPPAAKPPAAGGVTPPNNAAAGGPRPPIPPAPNVPLPTNPGQPNPQNPNPAAAAAVHRRTQVILPPQ